MFVNGPACWQMFFYDNNIYGVVQTDKLVNIYA